MDEAQQRPVYRHIVVQRRGYVEPVASPEDFRRLRKQLDAGEPVDEDLRHLVVNDTLRQTVRKVFGWSGQGNVPTEGVAGGGVDPSMALAEAQTMKERGEQGTVRYTAQQGVIVSRIIKEHIPGGDEPMPLHPQVLHHPGFADADDPQGEFLKIAEGLMTKFQAISDQKFILMDPEIRKGCTLVTLVLTPILALPRADRGIEVMCEFHQKTRLGYVDIENFEVYSEVGEYPILTPTAVDMALMMGGAEDFLAHEDR